MSTLIYKFWSYKAELTDNNGTLIVTDLDAVYTYQLATDPAKLKSIKERSVRWDETWLNLLRPYAITFQRDAKAKWTGNVKVFFFSSQQENYYYMVAKESKGTKK